MPSKKPNDIINNPIDLSLILKFYSRTTAKFI